MTKEIQLCRAIVRSETAYSYYKHSKKFHQALRIYLANKRVYELLVSFSDSCNEDLLPKVYSYIFHLDDWFAQFEVSQLRNPELEDTFVFERLNHGIPFPQEFKQLLY